jgi:hypothetical protein
VSKEDRIYIVEDANTWKDLVDEFDQAEHPFANQIASIDTNVSSFALKCMVQRACAVERLYQRIEQLYTEFPHFRRFCEQLF